MHNFNFLLLFFVLIIHLMFSCNSHFPFFLLLSPPLPFIFLSLSAKYFWFDGAVPWEMMDKGFTEFILLTFLQMCQFSKHKKKYPLITTIFTDALCAPFWLAQIHTALNLSDSESGFLTISMFVFACTKTIFQTQFAGMYKMYVSMEACIPMVHWLSPSYLKIHIQIVCMTCFYTAPKKKSYF